MEISPDLYQLLNGRDLETKQHEAMMLQTVTDDMWPHTAMVSVGEVLALSRTDLRLALWPGTTTTENMIRTGKALLVVIFSGKVHYVRLSLSRLAVLPNARHPRERLLLIAIGGSNPGDNLITRFDLLAADLCIGCGNTSYRTYAQCNKSRSFTYGSLRVR